MTSDPDFEKYCRETYIIEEDDSINKVTDEDAGYFSEDDCR